MSDMTFADLREFCARLEALGELKRVTEPVDTHLELTALADRVLRRRGPALLVERPHTQGRAHSLPALANLFGTPRRVLLGMGQDVGEDGDWREPLRDVGRLLAYLKEPETVQVGS